MLVVLTSVHGNAADAQKPTGGPAILADSFLQQPIGLQLAATAASVMAGALGGVQTGSLNQNGLHFQSGMNNDPLTHYLAKMSRAQLYEIMLEFKVRVLSAIFVLLIWNPL